MRPVARLNAAPLIEHATLLRDWVRPLLSPRAMVDHSKNVLPLRISIHVHLERLFENSSSNGGTCQSRTHEARSKASRPSLRPLLRRMIFGIDADRILWFGRRYRVILLEPSCRWN